MVKTLFHRLLTLSGTEYACYRVFRADLESLETQSPVFPDGYSASRITGRQLEQTGNEDLVKLSGFDGRDALGFAVFHHREIASVAWIWYGARYREERNFWPLGPLEAKIVQTYTIPIERGRNLSPLLMHYCNHALKQLGFERVFSRVWWNHRSSMRVTEKAGRTHIATVFELRFLGAKRSLRFVRRVEKPMSRR